MRTKKKARDSSYRLSRRLGLRIALSLRISNVEAHAMAYIFTNLIGTIHTHKHRTSPLPYRAVKF